MAANDGQRAALNAHDPERKLPHRALLESWMEADDKSAAAHAEYTRLAGDPGKPDAEPPEPPRKPEGTPAQIAAAWQERYRWWNAAELRRENWLRAVRQS